MITFKIIDYDLYNGQWRWIWDANTQTGKYEPRPLVHGQKVCSSQKLETMGVVTNIGEETDVITPYKKPVGPDDKDLHERGHSTVANRSKER